MDIAQSGELNTRSDSARITDIPATDGALNRTFTSPDTSVRAFVVERAPFPAYTLTVTGAFATRSPFVSRTVMVKVTEASQVTDNAD